MDKQMACATFATLIPIFLTAGYFASGMLEDLPLSTGLPQFIAVVLTVCLIGETLSIVGVVAIGSDWVFLAPGLMGTVLAMAGFFGALMLQLYTASVTSSDGHESQPQGDGDTGD